MEIRPPNKQNYEEIISLVDAALGISIGLKTLVDRVLYDSEYDPNLCLVAREKGKTLAYLAATRREDHGFLKLIAVHPENQRQGIASDLLSRLEARMAGENISRLTVGACPPRDFFPGVPDRYDAALAFFMVRGYQKAGAAWTASLGPQGQGAQNFKAGPMTDYRALFKGEHAIWEEGAEEALSYREPRAVATRIGGEPALLLARPGMLGPLFFNGDDMSPVITELVSAGLQLATDNGPAGLRDSRPLAWWKKQCDISASGGCTVFQKTLL